MIHRSLDYEGQHVSIWLCWSKYIFNSGLIKKDLYTYTYKHELEQKLVHQKNLVQSQTEEIINSFKKEKSKNK